MLQFKSAKNHITHTENTLSSITNRRWQYIQILYAHPCIIYKYFLTLCKTTHGFLIYSSPGKCITHLKICFKQFTLVGVNAYEFFMKCITYM